MYPISSRPPRSGTPPPCLPAPSQEEGERLWMLDVYDLFRRRWKRINKGEPFLDSDRSKRIFTDRGVRNFYLLMKKAMELQNGLQFFDSTNRLVPIQTRIRGYFEILSDKCQSNEVDWNDYPFFINSLIDGFPYVRIDDLISSLKFYKISHLEESERELRNAAIRKIRRTSNGEDQEEQEEQEEEVQECDLTDLEKTELFVQSLMARACTSSAKGFIEYDPVPSNEAYARLSQKERSSSNQ